MENVTNINRSATRRAVDDFAAVTKPRKSDYPLQVFVDFGGDPGPWVALGVNDTVYAIGWLPEEYR
jgi:hypothetical protein